jgi:CubicO group peptidase (beta-lactamase class C family)
MNRLPFILALLASAFLLSSGCSKEDGPEDPAGYPIGTAEEFLTLKPRFQPGTYRNVDQIFQTRTIARGSKVYPLPYSATPLTTVSYSTGGSKMYDIDDFISRNEVAGLLMIQDGEIVLERYAQGNTGSSRWMSFSSGKSIASTLIGMAVKDGYISSLNDPVTKYLPQMVSTAYDGVTIRQLLQMTSGVAWDEEYAGAGSPVISMMNTITTGDPGGILRQLAACPRMAEPGTRFNYSTGETHLECEVLNAALGGESASDYLSRKLWAAMGMEADAAWVLESPGGHEFGGGGNLMTLRDYGRFGLFILNGGVIEGVPQLPEGWIDEATLPAPDTPSCDFGALYAAINQPAYIYLYPLGYGYNWWSLPPVWNGWENLDKWSWWGTDAISDANPDFPELAGTFEAEGIFGQFIHINREEKIVTVLWSTWDMSWSDPKEYEFYCFLNAATGALRK